MNLESIGTVFSKPPQHPERSRFQLQMDVRGLSLGVPDRHYLNSATKGSGLCFDGVTCSLRGLSFSPACEHAMNLPDKTAPYPSRSHTTSRVGSKQKDSPELHEQDPHYYGSDHAFGPHPRQEPKLFAPAGWLRCLRSKSDSAERWNHTAVACESVGYSQIACHTLRPCVRNEIDVPRGPTRFEQQS